MNGKNELIYFFFVKWHFNSHFPIFDFFTHIDTIDYGFFKPSYKIIESLNSHFA